MATEQAVNALELANKTRLGRYELRVGLKAGTITLAEAFADEWAQGATVASILKAQRRWGDDRVRRTLTRVPMTEAKLVKDLTPRQRNKLLELAAK